MKALFLLVFMFVGNLLWAQNKWEANFSISNQGQTDRILEDFYFPAHPTALMDDAHTGKDIRIKYNATFSYQYKDSFEVRLRFGYAQRKNHYEQDFLVRKWIVDDRQDVVEITPSFGFYKSLGRFTFGTGVEIPVYIIGELNEKIDFREYADSVNLSSAAYSDITMDGGIIAGLNHYVRLKTHFSDHFFMFSECNYGLLYAQLGGKYTDNGAETFPALLTYQMEMEKKYSKIYFSPVQVQFGIGYRF